MPEPEVKKPSSFEAASLSYGELVVRRLAGTPPDISEEVLDFTMVLDFHAMARALEEIGKDLTDIRNWQSLSGVEIITVAWCALARFHPAITLADFRGMIPPAQTYELGLLLEEMCFPGITERVAEIMRMQEQSEKEGEQSPNPPSVAGANATS